MPENFELLETGQIEIMHSQVHNRLESDGGECHELRRQHDSLAAELVKRGMSHDTEMICPGSELGGKAPNYRRGFTDDICTQCAFGQLFPFCNLYKADYVKGFTCDSFRYFEILELEPPHGFLMAQEKQTAIALDKPLDKKSSQVRVIISNGEAFGIAVLDEPAQIKTKEFDTEEWLNQHRVTPRERRQWWPDVENFYVYRLKEWYPYEGVKLYEDGKVIDEPKLTAKQWQIVSKAKDLPKQITLVDDAVLINENLNFTLKSTFPHAERLSKVLSATYQIAPKYTNDGNEHIPLYSLALVRNPRMRVSKKNVKQEGETMPFGITQNDEGEYCVINTDTDEVQACHETEAEAEAQLAALRINVEAEEGESAIYSDKPKKRKPKKKDYIEILEDGEAVLPPKVIPEKPKKTGFMESLQKLSKSIVDFLRYAETEENEVKLFVSDVGISQKVVNGEVWHFAYSTNAFEDREKEIFSTKALEDYVSNNETSENKGFFNLWHINKEDGNFSTDFAEKKWQGVVGRFLVEAGPYLEDEKGQAAKKFFKQFGDKHPEIAPEGWGCSPEFRYLPEERAKKTYETIWITRTSTLPRFAAANVWTETRQMNKRGIKMALSEQQMKAAIEVFGDDFVSRMTQEAEDKTAELEAAGVVYKGEKENEPQENESQENEPQEIQLNIEELAAEVGKQFSANLTPIAEAMATMATELKELKEWKEKQDKTQGIKDKTEKPRFVFNMQRASEQDETIVTDDDGLKNAKPKETQVKESDTWARTFNK